ncbi:unnamed protein product [Gordionus sp. m RMFG-2023]
MSQNFKKSKNKKQVKNKGKIHKDKDDEEIESFSDEDIADKIEGNDSSEEDLETPQEKRLRIAKEYISQIEQEEDHIEDDKTRFSVISNKLTEEMLEKSGKLQRYIANKYTLPTKDNIILKRGHKLTPTCAIISSDVKYIFSSSKDGIIIKWDLESMKRLGIIRPGNKKSDPVQNKKHKNQIIALALSFDNKFLASGGLDKIIHIWDPLSLEHIHSFKGHKNTISGLVFRHKSHQLFSASFDRFVKIWDLDLMSHVETLFGHQEAITDIDSFISERCVTSGGRDSAAHLWKIVEETQLVYRFPGCSVDRIRYINEDHFMTGTDEGTVSIWNIGKKKPLVTFNHRQNVYVIKDNDVLQNPFNKVSNLNEPWITALGVVYNSDLIAIGISI